MISRGKNKPQDAEPDHSPREGWADAFRAAESGNAEVLPDSTPPNAFDDEEWRW